jgi:hypothetical protein
LVLSYRFSIKEGQFTMCFPFVAGIRVIRPFLA